MKKTKQRSIRISPKEARVEVRANEVQLIFVIANDDDDREKTDLANSLMRQLKTGAISLNVLGTPSKVW